MFRNTNFVLQKSTNPQSKQFGVQDICMELSGAVVVWITVTNIFTKKVKAEYFAKGTEKCKIPDKLMEKEVENLDDHGYPKIRDLVDPKVDRKMRIYSSYPFRPKTTHHCAERKAKLLGQWTM